MNKKVKTIPRNLAEKFNLDSFPNFLYGGNILAMKREVYGKDALLVRCGKYIYNVTSQPEIYNEFSY